MFKLKHSLCAILLSATPAVIAACGDDGPNNQNDAAIDSPDIDAAGCVCDPVGPLPMQTALENAPVKSDVEVLTRDYRHPGCPGPTDLP